MGRVFSQICKIFVPRAANSFPWARQREAVFLAGYGEFVARLRVVAGCCSQARLYGNLGKKVHSPDRGRHSEFLARTLLHAQNLGVTAHPALFPAGQLRRQDQDQFDVRAFHHLRARVQEYAIGAYIAGLSDQLRFAGSASDADRQLGNNSLAGPSINLIIHN